MDAKNGQSQVRMTVLQFFSTPPTHYMMFTAFKQGGGGLHRHLPNGCDMGIRFLQYYPKDLVYLLEVAI